VVLALRVFQIRHGVNNIRPQHFPISLHALPLFVQMASRKALNLLLYIVVEEVAVSLLVSGRELAQFLLE